MGLCKDLDPKLSRREVVKCVVAAMLSPTLAAARLSKRPETQFILTQRPDLHYAWQMYGVKGKRECAILLDGGLTEDQAKQQGRQIIEKQILRMERRSK